MKANDLRARTTADLLEEVAAMGREIANLRFRAGSEKGSDPSKIGLLRRDLARLRTVLRERDLDIRGQAAHASAGKPRKAAS